MAVFLFSFLSVLLSQGRSPCSVESSRCRTLAGTPIGRQPWEKQQNGVNFVYWCLARAFYRVLLACLPVLEMNTVKFPDNNRHMLLLHRKVPTEQDMPVLLSDPRTGGLTFVQGHAHVCPGISTVRRFYVTLVLQSSTRLV